MSSVTVVSISADRKTRIKRQVPIESGGESLAVWKKRHFDKDESLWKKADVHIDVDALNTIIDDQGGEMLCVEKADDGTFKQYLYKISRTEIK
jgi:hypothetical protein